MTTRLRWILTPVLLPSILAGQVVIHEIHYDPADKTAAEEFVELHNAGDAAVDLSGWMLADAVSFVLPAGTVIGPQAYLVVAQDPGALTSRFGPVPAVGPFNGRLSNRGERIALYNQEGGLEDEVDYRRGFPWPTVGGDEGLSIELIHPDLRNDVGGSWRASDPGISSARELVPAGAQWRYLEGRAEASSPRSAWREIAFPDASWSSGSTSIGYGEGFLATVLSDMRDGYTSVYLRRTFQVDDVSAVGGLTLEVQYDDGFNAWINGNHVAGANVPASDLPYDGTADSAIENLDFETFRLPPPSSYLVEGTNVLAIQLHNASLGGSSDAFLDARLLSGSGPGSGPTPGGPNSVFSTNSAPQIRQVNHFPGAPVSTDFVILTARVSDPDGVATVTLEYQTVDPGAYIRIGDPEYQTAWTSMPMLDDGSGLDTEPGDDIFTAVLTESVQSHRRLVRYRIVATDRLGESIRVPYPDDPQPNFAYFVHDGIPAWSGASRPGVTQVRDFDEGVMRSLPVYHLIADGTDVERCQYNSSYEATHFPGTMVYEGEVYDHIEYEVRGEFSTYVSGKNKWRFFFNRGHEFQARDNFGREYRETWRKMNLSAVATPWVPVNRGMAGLGESVAFKLYDLAGSLGPHTNYLQFRIVDEAVEASAPDQYRGDLWGLYMTIEHTDGSFLDERGLPDGNTYKIEGGNGDKRNQGPTQSVTSADYNALKSGYNSSQPISWWRANVDLEGYYSFRAVNRAVNNMDLREGWNICMYHNPETDLWTVIPWDLDMLYMPITHWSGVMNFQNALSQHTQLLIEYRNRARELQDLLFTPDQLGQLVDELAGVTNPSGRTLTWVDIDEAMWNYHPRTASSHRGAFYRNPASQSFRGGTVNRTLVSADHEGFVRWIEDFTLRDYGADQLEAHARDSAIPARPTISAIGTARFPIDELSFRCSPFEDPQGAATFGAMKWRVAEVRPTDAVPGLSPDPLPYEIESAWESEELAVFNDTVKLPAAALKIGATYRARVRMADTSGRWSHWSLPVEFTTSPPGTPFPTQESLRITEIMYHPPEGAELEFIELKNIGDEWLDLSAVSFKDGIAFRFADGAIDALAPGENVLVVRDATVFAAKYPLEDLPIAGEYSGRLGNGSEHIVLVHGANATILDFTYLDTWHPLTDGQGHSLVILDPEDPPALWSDGEAWRESAEIGGSPGWDDSGPLPGGRRLPGDLNENTVVDIGDAVSLIFRLFRESGGALPCDGATIEEGGNLPLVDFDGNALAEVTDAIGILEFLFLQGPPHALGTRCIRIEGCTPACR